jgi:hypothetical protein
MQENNPMESNHPMVRYRSDLDRESLLHEAEVAVRIATRIAAEGGFAKSWINFPLFNQTGDPDDFLLTQYEGDGRPTPHTSLLPHAARIVEEMQDAGTNILYARLAILFGRDVLRPHIDMYQARRLLVPLSEQRQDFRHVAGEFCVAMRVGEMWGIDGSVPHGAANVGDRGHRVMLLIDAAPRNTSSLGWWSVPWRVPAECRVPRKPWSPDVRSAYYNRAAAFVATHGADWVEREWLFVPFEHEMRADYVFAEMLAFARWMEAHATNSAQAQEWAKRAQRLEQPALACEIVPPPLEEGPDVPRVGAGLPHQRPHIG